MNKSTILQRLSQINESKGDPVDFRTVDSSEVGDIYNYTPKSNVPFYFIVLQTSPKVVTSSFTVLEWREMKKKLLEGSKTPEFYLDALSRGPNKENFDSMHDMTVKYMGDQSSIGYMGNIKEIG